VDLPTPLAKLIETCCEKDPAKRLPDMRAFRERLDLARSVLLKRQAAKRSDQTAAGTSRDES
jgi:hypothetical protein